MESDARIFLAKERVGKTSDRKNTLRKKKNYNKNLPTFFKDHMGRKLFTLGTRWTLTCFRISVEVSEIVCNAVDMSGQP